MLRLLASACRPRYNRRRHASSVASLMRSLLPSNYQSIVDEEKKLLIELHQTLHEMVTYLLIRLLTESLTHLLGYLLAHPPTY